jgi:hypothetical protein
MNPIPLITTIYSQWLKRKERRAQACAEFRRTFLQELEGLYPSPSDWPRGYAIINLLKIAFPKLQTAVALFRPFVPDNQKPTFDQAWCEYKGGEGDIQDYQHYTSIRVDTRNADGEIVSTGGDGKATFKKNVDRLLAFAQDT